MNPEDLVTRTLSEVADQTDHPSTAMTTVTARAQSLRGRRRRTTALAAAAAVALVVTPTALWLNGGHATSPEPTKKPSSASPTVSAAATRQALEALPRGPRPALAYVAGRTYVDVGGGRSNLPRNAVSAVPAQGGGLLVFTLLPSGRAPIFTSGTAGRISVADRSVGAAHDLGCGTQRFAISADRTQSAYWMMNGCHPSQGGTLHAGPLSTMGESGQQGTPTPKGYAESPVGFVRSGVVANALPTSGTDVSTDGVWVLGNGPAHEIPGLRYASAVSEAGPSGDLVAGQLRSGGYAVVDPASGAVQWNAAATWSVDAFSLDGRYAVARSTAGDGNALEILDTATGHLVTQVPAVRGTDVLGEAWGEDGSLVILLGTHAASGSSRGAVSALVRCSPSGHLTRATPVTPDQGNHLFYGFGTNP